MVKYLGCEAKLRVQLEVLGVKVLPLLNVYFVMWDPPRYDDVVTRFRRGAFLKR